MNMINTVECSIFIDNLNEATRKKQYLVPNCKNGAGTKFGISPIKSAEFKTAQITEMALKCCNFLQNSSDDYLNTRIKLLTTLDSSLSLMANRIVASIKRRWYYPILNWFGYKATCPKMITKIENSIRLNLSKLRDREARLIDQKQKAAVQHSSILMAANRKDEIPQACLAITSIQSPNPSVHLDSVPQESLLSQVNKVETTVNDVPCTIHFSNGITRIEDAQILLFGENHVDEKHSALETQVINKLSGPEDIVLLEGLSKDQRIDPTNPELQGTGLYFDSHVLIKGWEDMETNRLEGEVVARMVSALNASETQMISTVSASEQRDIIKKLHEFCLERSHHMVHQIKSVKERAKRIFVIAGARHLIDDNFNALDHLKNYKCAMIMPHETRIYTDKETMAYILKTT